MQIASPDDLLLQALTLQQCFARLEVELMKEDKEDKEWKTTHQAMFISSRQTYRELLKYLDNPPHQEWKSLPVFLEAQQLVVEHIHAQIKSLLKKIPSQPKDHKPTVH